MNARGGYFWGGGVGGEVVGNEKDKRFTLEEYFSSQNEEVW